MRCCVLAVDRSCSGQRALGKIPYRGSNLIEGSQGVLRGSLNTDNLGANLPVASDVRFANIFTSFATTPKPRPASPERAASIVALSARRLVCSAMAEMRLTTSPTRSAASASCDILRSVSSACSTAACATSLDVRDCRLISPDDVEISSVAPLTTLTLADACSAADATVLASCLVPSAALVKVAAEASIWDDVAETELTISPIVFSKLSARVSISALRSKRASRWASICDASISAIRNKLSLNAAAARAASPISSVRRT